MPITDVVAMPRDRAMLGEMQSNDSKRKRKHAPLTTHVSLDDEEDEYEDEYEDEEEEDDDYDADYDDDEDEQPPAKRPALRRDRSIASIASTAFAATASARPRRRSADARSVAGSSAPSVGELDAMEGGPSSVRSFGPRMRFAPTSWA